MPILNSKCSEMAMMVPTAKALPVSGCSQTGNALAKPGTIDTPKPNAIEMPSTNIRRPSKRREEQICMAVGTTKAISTSKITPITDCGIIANKAASLGKNANSKKQMPAPMPICRLVAPVATVRPTLPELVVCPIVPSRPPLIVPNPSASSPSPTDLMSSRFQPSSFTFWQVVRLPMVLMLEHNAAIRNGANKAGSKRKPTWLRLGKATHGVSWNFASCSGEIMSRAKAAT